MVDEIAPSSFPHVFDIKERLIDFFDLWLVFDRG